MSVVQELNLSRIVINFIGLEGSGKTDLSEMLAAQTGLPIFPTGDTLRWFQANDQTELGDACREMFKNDGYLDGAMMLGILEERLKDTKFSKGLIMDGGLRTVKETEGYREMLKAAGRDFPVVVIKLNITEELGIKRLLAGGRKGRKPDTPESITARHDRYKYRLEERLELMQKMENCKVIEVDASGTINENYAYICSALMNLLAGDLV